MKGYLGSEINLKLPGVIIGTRVGCESRLIISAVVIDELSMAE
jgi:hypothetical protein